MLYILLGVRQIFILRCCHLKLALPCIYSELPGDSKLRGHKKLKIWRVKVRAVRAFMIDTCCDLIDSNVLFTFKRHSRFNSHLNGLLTISCQVTSRRLFYLNVPIDSHHVLNLRGEKCPRLSYRHLIPPSSIQH